MTSSLAQSSTKKLIHSTKNILKRHNFSTGILQQLSLTRTLTYKLQRTQNSLSQPDFPSFGVWKYYNEYELVFKFDLHKYANQSKASLLSPLVFETLY